MGNVIRINTGEALTKEQKEILDAAGDAWRELVESRIRSIYGEDAQLFPQVGSCSWLELKDYLIRSIRDYLREEEGKPLFRPQLTFSSKGKTLVEILDFLIVESEKVLFPSGERFMSGLLYDEYDLTHGTAGLLSVLQDFVKWTNTAA